MKRLLLAVALGAVLAGCGLSVQSPDLFLLTRSGAGGRLKLLVSDDGTISFPDTAARSRSELAQLELFAVQASQTPCGLGG